MLVILTWVGGGVKYPVLAKIKKIYLGNDFYLQYESTTKHLTKMVNEGKTPRFLHLVFAPYLCRESGEIKYHWYPIVNYAAFCCRRSISPKG